MINDETENGVRVCYRGPVPKGYSGKKTDGIYTIRQYLKLADAIYEDRSNNKGGSMLPDLSPPLYKQGYTYLNDFTRLQREMSYSNLCTNKRGLESIPANWMRCQDCEDSMKGDDIHGQREQRNRRDRRDYRRTMRQWRTRRANRGVVGAREALARTQREWRRDDRRSARERAIGNAADWVDDLIAPAHANRGGARPRVAVKTKIMQQKKADTHHPISYMYMKEEGGEGPWDRRAPQRDKVVAVRMPKHKDGIAERVGRAVPYYEGPEPR